MKYIFQPYYNDNVIRVYPVGSSTVAKEIGLQGAGGPNGVVFFSDPATGASSMFVSFDEGSAGRIDQYALDGGSPPNATFVATLPAPGLGSAAGMAVQPGSGDLYVATFNNNTQPGGVLVFARASNYTALTQFSSYSDPSVTTYCANLAFDANDNLWMTTFDGDGGHFLICYTSVAPGQQTQFFKFLNGAALGPVTALPGSGPAPASLLPLSQPEGIAFDPWGNLWLANNNDQFAANGGGDGSLLCFSRAWIDALLENPGALDPVAGFANGGKLTASPPDIVTYYFAGAKFGGLRFDGFTLYVNDQDSADGSLAGETEGANNKVWAITLDGTPASKVKAMVSTSILTTYPGNGAMGVLNSTPAKLLVRETEADDGAEPDNVYNCWESPDIGVVDASKRLANLPNNIPSTIPDNPDLTSFGSAVAGAGYVYVRVANWGKPGDPSTTGSEVVKLYWGKASAGLDWPAPWNGLMFDTTAAKPSLGDLIGAQPLGVIDPGNQSVLEFPWGIPDTSQYSVNDGHFCLLARVERDQVYPFGMDYPEEVGEFATDNETSIGDNTRNNNTIGWRNVALQPAQGKRHWIRVGVVSANLVGRARVMRFAAETVDSEGLPAHLPGEFALLAEGASLQRLLEPSEEGHAERHLGEGRFDPYNLRVRLRRHETLPLAIEFKPASDLRNFAIRFTQYVETRRGPRPLGGQTFVFGKVRGLHN